MKALVFFAVLFSSEIALGCDCGISNLKSAYKEAGAVFLGKVTAGKGISVEMEFPLKWKF